MAILNSDQDILFHRRYFQINFRFTTKSLQSIPSHCSLYIESFSLLTEYHGVNGFEANEFEAGGYSWKLVLYPNGNKKKNVEDHLSVYLRIAGEDTLQAGWGECVDFRLFLLDHTKGRYLVVEDPFTKQKNFHAGMLDVGFDKLISLEEFTNISNGYLINDKCVFGAEVFVCKERKTGKADCISRIKSPCMYKHVWELQYFSELDLPCHRSQPFTVEGQKWMIKLYPKGDREGNNTHLSLYLGLVKQTTPVTRVYAHYSLRILDRGNGKHQFGPVKYCFNTTGNLSGCSRFIPLRDLRRFVWHDTLKVEAEITVVGIAKPLPEAKDIVDNTGEKGLSPFNSSILFMSISTVFTVLSIYLKPRNPAIQ